jgi:hypothetical protein
MEQMPETIDGMRQMARMRRLDARRHRWSCGGHRRLPVRSSPVSSSPSPASGRRDEPDVPIQIGRAAALTSDALTVPEDAQ